MGNFTMSIESVVYERSSLLEEGAADYFPNFRVKGLFNGLPMEAIMSIELDGRDAEFETVVGPNFYEHPDAWDPVFDAIYATEDWKKVYQAI